MRATAYTFPQRAPRAMTGASAYGTSLVIAESMGDVVERYNPTGPQRELVALRYLARRRPIASRVARLWRSL